MTTLWIMKCKCVVRNKKVVIYVWTTKGESPELDGENSFTSKCSEKSQPLDSYTSKKFLPCINITAITVVKAGQII